MMQRFSKTTLALALAAGLMLPVLAAAGPALAHEEPCPPGFVLSVDLTTNDPADRNDNDLLCGNQRSAQQIFIDDHIHPEPDPE